jgi:hypothetical protein
MVYDAEPPDGGAYVKVFGLDGVPEPPTVNVAVVLLNVSKKWPLESAVTWLPLRSVKLPAPLDALSGGLKAFPEGDVTVTDEIECIEMV